MTKMKIKKSVKQLMKDGDKRRLSTIQLIENDLEELLHAIDEVEQSVITKKQRRNSISKSCNDVINPKYRASIKGSEANQDSSQR